MDVPLRITILDPPEGVTFRVQSGRSELVEPVTATREAITFEISLRVRDDDGVPNFLGPFAQGPRGERFVYVNSGTLAGQQDSCWTRRAKLHLAAITWAMIEKARHGGVIETTIPGRARDGGPICAKAPVSWTVR